MALLDHVAVELGIEINSATEKMGRWRMNTSLLQNETFCLLLKGDHTSFFKLNADSTDTKAME